MSPDVDTLARELEGYREPLLQLARGLLRRWPSIDPSDAVQKTFVQAIERPSENIDNLEAWLRGVLRHRVIDAIRAAIRSASEQLPSGEPGTGTSPSQGPIRREESLRLEAALAQLREAERAAVELHYFFDCTQAEVAAYLGCTRPAVAGLIRRGMDKLRNLLNHRE